LRPLVPDIIRFVEELAIADARRDHLSAAQTTAIDGRAATDLSSQVEASTNDSSVIYARFSTDLQNEKSTEDQIALCRAHAARRACRSSRLSKTRHGQARPSLVGTG
jgi:hypothetical protein